MSVTPDGDEPGSVPGRAGRRLGSRVQRLLRGPRAESVPALIGTACTLIGLIDMAAGVFPSRTGPQGTAPHTTPAARANA